MRNLPILAGLLLAVGGLAHAAPPPVAAVKNVPDHAARHHRRTTPTAGWKTSKSAAGAGLAARRQGAVARAVLDRIEGRDAIAKRLAELADAQGDTIRGVTRMPGERCYYLKRARGEQPVQAGDAPGRERRREVLVDPEASPARTGVPHAINYFRPSWDGKLPGLRHVGRRLGRRLAVHPGPGQRQARGQAHAARARVAAALAARQPVADLQPAGRTASRRARNRHLQGQPRAVAASWAGAAAAGLRPHRHARTWAWTAGRGRAASPCPGSPWVVARTTDTTVPEGKLFVAPLASTRQARHEVDAHRRAAPTRWYDVALQGDDLYRDDAGRTPRRKIVARGPAPARLAEAPRWWRQSPPTACSRTSRLTPGGLMVELRQGTAVRAAPPCARATRAGQAWSAGAGRRHGLAGAHPAPRHTTTLLYAFSGWTEPLRYLPGKASRHRRRARWAHARCLRACPKWR